VPVRLTKKEAQLRRAANKARTAELIERFRLLDIDPIVVTSSERGDVLEPFLVWTSLRRTRRLIGA
jgi:hypothetical protein